MSPGRIEEYKKAFDLNKDGELTTEEIQHSKSIMELELKEEKAEAHKRLEIQAKLRNQAMHMERAGDNSPQFWCLPQSKSESQ
jgi:hypothetical protein